MEVNIEHKERYDVIMISDNVDIYNVAGLRNIILNTIDGHNKVLALDLRYVYYMDSSGIGALVAGQKKMKAHNGKFGLMNIHDDVLNILKLATLDKFFTIYSSEDKLI